MTGITAETAGIGASSVGMSYAVAAGTFLEDALWLSQIHLPLAVQLRALAVTLDTELAESGRVSGTLARTFAQTWERLQPPDAPAGPADPRATSWDQPIPGLDV